MKYTVTWEQTALAELAKLWCDNPNLHGEIQKASDEIDRVLFRNPHRFDVLYHESTCELGCHQSPWSIAHTTTTGS